MADDKLDFLDETETPEEVVETPDPEVEEEETPVEAEAEAEPETGAEEPEVPPTPEAQEEKQTAPLMALLDERDKRQSAERKAEEAARELQRLQQQIAASQNPPEKPDYFDNPEQAMQQQIANVTLRQSRFLAEREFGKELVEQAHAYFDQNPQESQTLMDHPSPYHAAVEVYKRQMFMQEVGSDPDAWKAKQLEELKAQIAAETPQPVQPKTPPPSMAKSPRAGGEGSAPGNAFDQVFT